MSKSHVTDIKNVELAKAIAKVNGLALYCFKPNIQKSCSPHVVTHVLFSHANGVSARSYSSLLQSWSNATGLTIYTYDVRGMGLSNRPTASAYASGKNGLWKHLIHDLHEVFDDIREREPHAQLDNWLLAGHSLGGWLSLLSAHRTHVNQVLLCDIPLLPIHRSVLWTVACAFGIRSMHPLAKVARRRKRQYKSLDQAKRSFVRNIFFKTWPEHLVQMYIDANFKLVDEKLELLHDPMWEADIFEAMPANTFTAIAQVPNDTRANLKVTIFAGSESTVCRPSWNRYVNWFFPNTKWVSLAKGGHMFPFEREQEFLAALSTLDFQK